MVIWVCLMVWGWVSVLRIDDFSLSFCDLIITRSVVLGIWWFGLSFGWVDFGGGLFGCLIVGGGVDLLLGLLCILDNFVFGYCIC